MKETHKISIIVVPISWALALIGGLTLYFAVSKAWSISFVLGVATALMNLGFTVKGGKQMLSEIERKELGKPLRRNMIYFIFRVLVFIAVFGVVINEQFIANPENPGFNVYATLIGYVLVKLVLIVVSVIMKGREK